MSKTSTDLARHALSGPTMGARWTALFFMPHGYDAAPLRAALQEAVDEVDAQMSTWKPESGLMRLNRAPIGQWLDVPDRLLQVIRLGLDIGRASGGTFDIGVGDAVRAWGFGPDAADSGAIRAALVARLPAHDVIELADGKLWKHAPVTLDLNGIAKGYGVDRLAETLLRFGIASGLVGIDGEMRAMGLRPGGDPWPIAIEAPDPLRRAAHSVITLQDAAVATSGDYRQYIDVQGMRLAHTIDPGRGAPLQAGPASVTVVARSCAEADGWATALMVLGVERGRQLAARLGIDALFLLRGGQGTVRAETCGPLFSGHPDRPRAA